MLGWPIISPPRPSRVKLAGPTGSRGSPAPTENLNVQSSSWDEPEKKRKNGRGVGQKCSAGTGGTRVRLIFRSDVDLLVESSSSSNSSGSPRRRICPLAWPARMQCGPLASSDTTATSQDERDRPPPRNRTAGPRALRVRIPSLSALRKSAAPEGTAIPHLPSLARIAISKPVRELDRRPAPLVPEYVANPANNSMMRQKCPIRPRLAFH